jgi:hypothetical protein
MYSPAFHPLLIDTRIEDLHRARGTSIHPHRGREDRNSRASTRFGWIRRAGIRRLEVADGSSATWSPRS